MAVRDNSRLGQLAAARAHQEASARARGLHPRQFAARGRAGQVAPVAARFARAHRTTSARPRGLHPWQFAPVAARFARAHRTTSACPRGCTPGNSRRVAVRDNSRLGQLAAARAHQEVRARPRGLHPWQFAARGRAGRAAFLRSARAGPSAKARWRNVKVFSQVFFKKLVGFGVKPQDLTGVRGVLVPGGHRSGPVYVATSVGAGRLPLADSTRGGSRDQPPPSHTQKRGDARPQQGGTL